MTHVEFLQKQSEQRLTLLDVEIREFRAAGRIALTYEDMMVRYGVGIVQARNIIRAIRSKCGGGKLGGAKVLPSEVLYWESLIDMREVRL
ncbi:MAG: hypothetical protein J6L83_05630 [Clostridia bacterium]|nr:hypothetical protein [Clostridia bacterium]